MTGIDLLTELRKNGLRQKDLAERLGVSAAAISKYVNGRKRITPERAELFMRTIHRAPAGPEIATDGQEHHDQAIA